MEFILGQRKIFKQVVVIAHNGQAFDHQFILNYTLTSTDLKPELIIRGTKIIMMSLGNVKFLDSLNYFPLNLPKLPQAFGLGYFKKKSASIALNAARVAVKNVGGKKKVRVPRIIPFDHSGGFLPLLPILGALGAVGSLAGGASAIAKTIIDAKNAKKKLEEDHRHNAAMESIGAKGSGLYLRKNRRGGFGLYLKKQQHPKNYQ
ncbi:hypothetical protein NQ315_003970 [Exocentrus adspersus]|uniref:DNA-directed DNA polymerase n=1 Tax=Exocentrus adspersus TaxID=1586481 RepID=A0AAV8V8M9_9CUCU|nr:hypothetical protein NQ315_003970 [Exocentrus adspersus]